MREIYERNSPAVSREGEGGCSPGTRTEILQQPVVKSMWRASLWRSMGKKRSTCSPWRSPSRASFLAGPPRRPMVEQRVRGGLHPIERTHIGAIHAELQLMGRIHVEKVHGGLSPMGMTPPWIRTTA